MVILRKGGVYLVEGEYLSGGGRRGGWEMRRVRLKGSTLGFIDVFGKEMKESEKGKVR